MNPLSGLVNYSDDENSSSTSSDDEQQVCQSIKEASQNKVTEATTETSKTVTEPLNNLTNKPVEQSATTEDLPRSVESKDKTASAPQRIESRVGDHNRRLIAAIAPKPIEGVDNWGIPDETTEPCSPGRVERIAHFLSLKASGHRLNHHLQRNKAFHNPRIYTKLVEFTEVDEIGSNFDKNDYDPHGFPKEMYIDGILETQKNLAEEKAMQQQNRTSVNFVPPQQQQPAKATTNLTEQQSAAMAQAMEAAARVASRIAKPPPVSTLPTAAVTPEKRRSKWDDTGRRDKRG